MQRFKNILFIADGSKGEQLALAKTLLLAQLNKASITVMSTLPESTAKYSLWNPTEAINEELFNSRQIELKKLIAQSRPKGARLKINTLIKTGTAHIEIIQSVLTDKFDLLAKANHNDTRIKEMVFGTLDMALLRKCPCPVYIIKPAKKMQHKNIVAAVDLIRVTKKQSNLDRQIMDLATSMAEIESGHVDIVHAWGLPHEKKIKNEERFNFYKSIETMQKEWQQIEKKHLSELANDYASFNLKSHLVKGEPEIVIPRFAKRHKTDLVVMGTIARTGIAGFFIGNTAEKILHSLNCSVLAIKPEGFKSPVK